MSHSPSTIDFSRLPLPELPEACETRCLEHYRHACEKHPVFADKIATHLATANAAYNLRRARADIKRESAIGNLSALSLLKCELLEMKAELNKGDTKRAIEEAYDAIAVLMRIIAVLEGKQKLGHPKEGEGECE